MTSGLRTDLDRLKQALLALPATGDQGFEGLVAVALAGISGVPFRLASSGSQFGVDGKAASGEDAISFECKRYKKDTLDKKDVLVKVLELSISKDTSTELWVLAATCAVGTQLEGEIRECGEEYGIATFILDWSESSLPLLAVALAVAKTTVGPFLQEHLDDTTLSADAIAALDAIESNSEFPSHSERIHSDLHEPALGLALAKPANACWLTNIFTDRLEARRALGQPLAPGDAWTTSPLARSLLIGKIKPFLTGPPQDRALAVLGDEGNGKSWLIAQCWLSIDRKPLMLMLTAEDFTAVHAAKTKELLIDKLIDQTGDHRSDALVERWRRRLKRWESHVPKSEPRLVVVIDGLNQRPDVNWKLFINVLRADLEKIGAHLIVTVRTTFYQENIKRQLIAKAAEVTVPHWSEGERDEILSAHGIDPQKVTGKVALSLRNPRLLGIALSLLEKNEIEGLEELSVSRLLFEHMRVQEAELDSAPSALEFAQELQEHAETILGRIDEKKLDDLTLFERDFKSVADGLFYVQLDDDPAHYTLGEDSLPLALGFALLKALRAAERNGHDLLETAGTIIEPVSTLDLTGEVVTAALTIATLDEKCPDAISAALTSTFAGLQNPDSAMFRSFAGMARERPLAFMSAASMFCLSGRQAPNLDWIKAALHEAKDKDENWKAMAAQIVDWLRCYTLAPEHGMFHRAGRDDPGKVAEEREERITKIAARIEGLSAAERKLREELVESDEGDLDAVARFAFELLAGKPLSGLAHAFVRWRFAIAINGGPWAPTKELVHAIRLNRVDWNETHAALKEARKVLEGEDCSETGQWALFTLLQATGDIEDAAKGRELVKKLREGQAEWAGWSLIEDYCTSDPCDPRSERPDNIAATAARYNELEVGGLHTGMSPTGDDNFFAMARPGLARFEPEAAIEKHREFADNVAAREGFPLRQGLLELHRHSALLSKEDALALIEAERTGQAELAAESLDEQDRWLISQYRKLIAFPQMSAEEQLDALRAQPEGDPILLRLMHVMKPFESHEFETVLKEAVESEDEHSQYCILAMGLRFGSDASDGVRKLIAHCLERGSKRVRIQAVEQINYIADPGLDELFVVTGWDGASLEKDHAYEAWHGSAILARAAAAEALTIDAAVERLAPQYYGRAATVLNDAGRKLLALRIDASIRRAANLDLDQPIPDIELAIREDQEPPLYLASEKAKDSDDDPESFFKALSETNERFAERQKRAGKAFDEFRKQLSLDKARVVLSHFDIEEFIAILEAAEEYGNQWYDLITGLPDRQRSTVHNIGLLLAAGIAESDPEKAQRLFSFLERSEPITRITFERTNVTLDAMMRWRCADNAQLRELCFQHLDRAATDHAIAWETLVALWSGKQAALESYIESRLETGIPTSLCRALMVAGFSNESVFNRDILEQYADTPGIIGHAQRTAKYAYERNLWAQHWFTEMAHTDEADEFWRASVQFSKIVDGRFYSWPRPNHSETFILYWHSAEDTLSSRFKKWQNKRANKLFGDSAPPPIFLALGKTATD